MIYLFFKGCPNVCCNGKCPAGFCHKCGENVGGILHNGQKTKTMEECSQLCVHNAGCHSFNWSPVYKGGWCSTNTNSDYTKEQIGDFILCIKNKFCDRGKHRKNFFNLTLGNLFSDCMINWIHLNPLLHS